MQDQPISGGVVSPSEDAQRVVLALLLEPRYSTPWSVRELAREIGNERLAADAVVCLHGAGLVHRLHEFVFATRSAARFHELADDA